MNKGGHVYTDKQVEQIKRYVRFESRLELIKALEKIIKNLKRKNCKYCEGVFR